MKKQICRVLFCLGAFLLASCGSKEGSSKRTDLSWDTSGNTQSSSLGTSSTSLKTEKTTTDVIQETTRAIKNLSAYSEKYRLAIIFNQELRGDSYTFNVAVAMALPSDSRLEGTFFNVAVLMEIEGYSDSYSLTVRFNEGSVMMFAYCKDNNQTCYVLEAFMEDVYTIGSKAYSISEEEAIEGVISKETGRGFAETNLEIAMTCYKSFSEQYDLDYTVFFPNL